MPDPRKGEWHERPIRRVRSRRSGAHDPLTCLEGLRWRVRRCDFSGAVAGEPGERFSRRVARDAACSCSGADQILCSQETRLGCRFACCIPEQPKCCTAKDEVRCCYPGQECGKRTVGDKEYVRCMGCPQIGETECGTICCGKDEVCADAGLEVCCEKGHDPCRGGGTIDCCDKGEVCTNGHCCEPHQVWSRGKCRSCARKGFKKCGKTCCRRKNQHCCYDDHCCGDSEDCCGQECCSKKTERCCGDHCCRKSESCCDVKGGCCPSGTVCTTSQGTTVCCPANRVASTGSGTVCCGPGEVATSGRCCPSTRPNCNTCDPPCRSGEFCRDGYCLPA